MVNTGNCLSFYLGSRLNCYLVYFGLAGACLGRLVFKTLEFYLGKDLEDIGGRPVLGWGYGNGADFI